MGIQMETKEIIPIVFGILIFIIGFIITIIPNRAINWLNEFIKELVYLPDNFIKIIGYILGLIGIAILVITILGR